MATVQTYVTDAKYDAWIDDDQILDSEVLRFFNEIYHELENAIVNQLREYFFRWDLALQNLIVSQNDYDLPWWTSTTNPAWIPELKKLFAVYVKYGTWANDSYYKARQVDFSELQYDLPYYWVNQNLLV